MPLVGVITEHIGWRNQFYLMGGICLSWAPVWFWYARDSPAEMPSDRKGFYDSFKMSNLLSLI